MIKIMYQSYTMGSFTEDKLPASVRFLAHTKLPQLTALRLQYTEDKPRQSLTSQEGEITTSLKTPMQKEERAKEQKNSRELQKVPLKCSARSYIQSGKELSQRVRKTVFSTPGNSTCLTSQTREIHNSRSTE